MNSVDISTDRPLTIREEDRLGTSVFATHLAQSLLKNRSTDSKVIGILGPWGYGKTSILNFMVEALNDAESPPLIMHFSPWMFSSEQDLIQLFLNELLLTLEKKSTKFQELIQTIKSFMNKLNWEVSLKASISTPIGIDLEGTTTANFCDEESSQVSTLVDLKEKISKNLEVVEQKIIVIIDDIDRLVPEQIRSVFQLVKSVCDFSNVTYVVSFDYDVVVHSLNRFHADKAEDYLEKIIQVPFHLPDLEQYKLNKLLWDKLDALFPEALDMDDESREHWGSIFLYGIEPNIKTPRDVIRLTNLLSMTYPLVKGEVFWVDFIAIETLKIFNLELYNEIRNNKQHFTGLVDGNETEKRAERINYYESLLTRQSDEFSRKTKELLKTLFPRLKCIYGSYSTDGRVQRDWRKRLRICSDEFFDAYFCLSISENSIRQSEMARLLDNKQSGDVFAEKFKEIARLDLENNRVNALLDKLRDFAEEPSFIENSLSILQAFVTIGDELIKATERISRYHFDFYSTELRIKVILREILKTQGYSSGLQSLQDLSNNPKSLVVLLDAVSILKEEYPDSVEALNQIEIGCIQKKLNSKELIGCQNLTRILYRWKALIEDNNDEDHNTIANWILEISKNPHLLKKLLVKLASIVKTSGIERFYYTMNYKDVAPFIQPELLEDPIQNLLTSESFKNEPKIQTAVQNLFRQIQDPKLRERDLSDERF